MSAARTGFMWEWYHPADDADLIARPCALAVLGCTTHTTNAPEPGTLRGVPGDYALCDGCRARRDSMLKTADARRDGEAMVEGFVAGSRPRCSSRRTGPRVVPPSASDDRLAA